MAITTETIPFDFDGLYEGIKVKFDEKGYDTSEGSNTSQLITAMAYLTSMLNANTAVNVNETILPLATKRNTALQDARALGYESSHIRSYEYLLDINLAAGDRFIPKYSKFTAEGKTFYYLGDRLDYTAAENVSGLDIQITVREGTLYKFEDYPETLEVSTGYQTDSFGSEVPQYYIDIPYVDVESDGIEVYLTYYDEFGSLITGEEWTQSKQFLIDADTILEKEFVRLDDIDFQTPRIYFKISGVGKGIRAGTIVQMNVLTSSGTDGGLEDYETAVWANNIGDSNITVTGASKLETQGSDIEEIASIKQNAPIFHNSANRAVTGLDYTAICNKQGAVKRSKVWGGDEEFPKVPGHIWFSYMPSASIRSHTNNLANTEYNLDIPEDLINWFIEDKEIKSTSRDPFGNVINPGVWDVLDNYKIPTLEFQNRHPLYLDFHYSIQILKYNIKTSKADIHQEIFEITDSMFTGIGDVLLTENFDVEYFHSNWEKRVDKNITDISGFNNELETKIMVTTKNVSQEYVDPDISDLYIPLAFPYEDIFNSSGKLIVSRLPSIDTESFIPSWNIDIYTDWSGAGAFTNLDKLIIAPIRSKQVDVYNPPTGANYSQVNFDKARIYPDFNDADVLTYEKVTIIKSGRKSLINMEMSGQLLEDNLDPLLYSLDPTTLITTNFTDVDEYGSLTIQADGSMRFAASLTELAKLSTSQIETQSYQVTATNDTIYTFTLTIAGNNDPTLTEYTFTSNVTFGNAVQVAKFGQWEVDPAVIPVELDYSFDWTFDPLNPRVISFIDEFGAPVVYGDTVVIDIETNNHIGYYHLFNNYKKYVTAQFFVDSSAAYRPVDYVPTTDQPYAYLTSLPDTESPIGKYWYTTDDYYVTTEGFLLDGENDLTPLTGRVIRKITKANYTNSLLKFDMFNEARYVDFNYNSPNFRVFQNVIPRLRAVDFKLNSEV